jgi:hypothetical protein
MFNDPFHPEEAVTQQNESTKRKLLAVVCAVAITAILLVGYAYFRKYHAQQVLENATPPVAEVPHKGPALAHVVMDEPTLEGKMTTVGGVVKNISNQPLSSVSVTLELRRRKDGKHEETVLTVTPGQLQPQQEGAYAAKFSIDDFASVKLTGVQADPQATELVYTAAQGKKRAPERLQPQVIGGGKHTTKPGDFINTPDNPGRVP